MAKRNFPERKKQQPEPFEKPRAEHVPEPEKKPVDIASTEDKPVIGVVSGCNLLNIRNKPGINGHVVGMISADDSVTIDMEKSTEDWYFITANIVPRVTITGYCMRKYISLLK